MPYQVRQLIEGKGNPVCVKRNDAVSQALALMIEYDYSQLPVIEEQDGLELPEGMITYEGILRGIRNFNLNIDDLKVRDVMVEAKPFTVADDLFDILDRLKNTNAVLIVDEQFPVLVGIVTSYDTTEYFRNRTEDLMRVEDIEVTIKDLIRENYTNTDGMLNNDKLRQAISKICHRGQGEKPKDLEELTMGEYINLLTLPESWEFFQRIFNLSHESVRELLNGIREVRNALAHFRGDITPEQRDRLKFGTEWLSRCQQEYQERKEQEKIARLMELSRKRSPQEVNSTLEALSSYSPSISASSDSTDFAVTESATGGGRYAALADWLQSQPGHVDPIQLSFNQIEEIIGTDLPLSARNHRAWWANDAVGHSHSKLWLDAGWRTTYINLTEERVTFSRIREREKAYISFFSQLLGDFRKKADFPIREANPDGASWIVLQTIPRGKPSFGSFVFSFARDKRLRVELYLDLLDREQTKAVFEKLYAQKEQLEQQVGEIEWERLDKRRASRLALYKNGQVTDQRNHAELRKWAVEAMIKFYHTLVEPAEKAITEAKNC